MENSLRRMGKGVLAVAAFYAMQATALPIFTFTEYSGFSDDVGPADYSGVVTGPSNVVPAVAPLYSTMKWVGGRKPQSSLELYSVNKPTSLLADTWTTISTLTHKNLITPGTFSWFGQDVWGRFIVSDSDGGKNTVLDSDNVITLGLTETRNKAACQPPNPVGSVCDDYFTFTAGLDDLFFTANDGSSWMATFRFANLTNAVQIENVIFTGEGMTSKVDVQVMVSNVDSVSSPARVSSIPEPTTLVIFGLGLLGLYVMNGRKLKRCKVAVATPKNISRS